ncbi:MAG: carboxylesterase family protein [Terricaulis sp.]
MLVRAFAAVLVLLTAACASSDPSLVPTAQGPLRGEVRADGSVLFRGVPFAAPPVGDLRWRAPAPPAAWDGERDATHVAPACAQNSYGWNAEAAASGSEDCLYLEVRRPGASAGVRLPVMVWIHGGSNRAGSGAGKVLSSMVDRGIVMVGVQYRLGAFGFLSHVALSEEPETHASGNYGLMDQIAALRWVQENIAAFGGDPDNVTIAGDSAGGQDVNLLLVAPAARGLFAKAIAQSGTAQFGWPVRTLGENEAIGAQLAEAIGARGDDPLIAMRAAPTARILAADLALASPTLTDQSFLWLQAVVDGDVIPAPPHDLMARGASADAALLIGSNARELGLPGGAEGADAFAAMAFGAEAARARALYSAPSDPRLGDRLEQMGTDVIFRCPAAETALLHTRAGRAAYQYEFDHPATDGGVVRHGAELSYVSDNLPLGDTDVRMQDYWANFAKTGDPNGAGLPAWPRFDEASRGYITFSEAGAHVGANLRGPFCALLPRL